MIEKWWYLLVLAVRLVAPVAPDMVLGRKLCRSAGVSRTSGRKASSVDDATEERFFTFMVLNTQPIAVNTGHERPG